MGIKVAIRADGGQRVGMGHLIRCVSLAHEIQQLGHEVVFICCQDTGLNLLQEQGFKVRILPDHQHYTQEMLAIKVILRDEKIDALIVDTYAADSEYFKALQDAVYPLVYIDDLNISECSAHIVVNGNVYANEMGYKPLNREQMLLVGAEYNLLRSQYRDMPPRQLISNIVDILLTTGGSDPFCLSSRYANWLLNLDDYKRIHLVVGSGFSNLELINRLQEENPERVIVHQHLNDLSSLMLQMDLAISAGGSTLYELCACGTPTLAFIMAENQVNIVNWLTKKEYLHSLGWYHQVTLESLGQAVVKLENDVVGRQKMADRGQVLFDGYGANRVARNILAIAAKRGMQSV